ncbi:MAG: choice-of-anchor D domain-containing protein [Bryobacteraceae bacterium]
MIRALALAALLSAPLAAQLTLYTVSADGVETPVTADLLDLGAAHPGDVADTRFRIRNHTAANIPLTTLRVAGEGFSLQGQPTLPVMVIPATAPATNVDFRVRFRPTGPGVYSATFQVNDRAVLVRAIGRDGITLLGPNGSPIAADQAYDFGRVEAGSSSEQRFTIRNNTAGPLFVVSIAISGDAFTIVSPPSLPAKLDAGTEIPLTLRFAPTRAGIPAATLTIDARTFRLQGFASSPAVADAIVDLPATAVSAKQIPVAIRLAAPAPIDVTATVVIGFRSAIEGYTDDAAIQFVPAASRTATVTIPRGEQVARWGRDALTQTMLQTGTTAGDITVRVTINDKPVDARLTVAPTGPVIDTVTVVRGANGIEITADGFDNSRTVSELRFTFYDASGARLAEPLAAAVGDQFTRYFRESTLGGLFRLSTRVPIVSGDASGVAGVEIELRNALAAASTGRLRF